MRKTTRHGDKYALLGKTEDGDKVYLEKASYNHGWYFGFGYVAVFRENEHRQSAHTHWNRYFTGKAHVTPEKIDDSLYDEVDGKLKETPFSKRELWKLCDLMKTFYTLKDASAIYRNGNSHLTGQTHGMLKNQDIKEQVDRDTYKTIYEVQNLMGFEMPALVKSCPEHVKGVRDEKKEVEEK